MYFPIDTNIILWVRVNAEWLLESLWISSGRFSHPSVTTNFGVGLSHQEPSPSRLSLLLFSSFIVVFPFFVSLSLCISLQGVTTSLRPRSHQQTWTWLVERGGLFLSLCFQCKGKRSSSWVTNNEHSGLFITRLTGFHFPNSILCYLPLFFQPARWER